MNLGYEFTLLMHILLLVFWLGTDIGVFVSAIWIKKTGRPMSERWVLLQLAGALDVLPRLCAALMFPHGVTLARERWGLEIAPVFLRILWIIALAWCVAIVTAYREQNSPLSQVIRKVQIVGLALAGIGAMTWGLWLLSTGATFIWLALKIILFGLIYFIAIGIELAFRPVVEAMVVMPAQGGTPAQEARLGSAITICCAVVLTLHVVLLAASALGTVKWPV